MLGLGKRKGNTNFFVDNYSVYHRIHPSKGAIKFHMQYSLQVKLLPQKEYILMLFDPAYVIPSNNPEVVPRTSLIVKPNSIANLYLKVKTKQYSFELLLMFTCPCPGYQALCFEYGRKSL